MEKERAEGRAKQSKNERIEQFLKEHKHEGLLSEALKKVATYLDTHRQILERQIDDQFPMIVPAFVREAIATAPMKSLEILYFII